jgi:hypothetical protein
MSLFEASKNEDKKTFNKDLHMHITKWFQGNNKKNAVSRIIIDKQGLQ